MDRRLFQDIPENYKMQSIASSCPVISQAIYSMLLRKTHPLFCDESDVEQNLSVMREMALDFVFSADGLAKYYISKIQAQYDKSGNFLGYSFNPRCLLPISYLCRHAIELLLKYVWMVEHGQKGSLPRHSLLCLWQDLDLDGVPDKDKFTDFISELNSYDPVGMNLRYGLSRNFEPFSLKSYMFSPEVLLQNTKYLFNVLEPWVLNKLLSNDESEVNDNETN